MSALGVYGATVITAITAQNTLGVTAVHDIPTDIVAAQFDAVCNDLAVDAIKIGMLSSVALVDTVASKLAERPAIPVILDPVMVAESGDPLLAEEAVAAIRTHLFPLAALITPNLHEFGKTAGGGHGNHPRCHDRAGPRAALLRCPRGAAKGRAFAGSRRG